MKLGERVEIHWEDAHEGYGDAAPGSISMFEMGYWGGYRGEGHKRVAVLWRRIDEFGALYSDGKIPARMVTRRVRIGGRPRGAKVPKGDE